jgi:release factor glutamine methyltransferase
MSTRFVHTPDKSAPSASVDGCRSRPQGWVTFLGLAIEIGPGVLVPRPETELLATTARDLVAPADQAPVVVDMCCGSGNLACAIADGHPGARVYACDLTEDCVEQARRNAVRLGFDSRLTAHRGDLFAALAGIELRSHVDLIVCNPPYISSRRLATDRADLLDGEPREAFDGGPYGLSIHQRLIREAPSFLKPGGWLALEFGVGQDRQIARLLDRSGCWGEIGFKTGTTGVPRVAMARLAGPTAAFGETERSS